MVLTAHEQELPMRQTRSAEPAERLALHATSGPGAANLITVLQQQRSELNS